SKGQLQPFRHSRFLSVAAVVEPVANAAEYKAAASMPWASRRLGASSKALTLCLHCTVFFATLTVSFARSRMGYVRVYTAAERALLPRSNSGSPPSKALSKREGIRGSAELERCRGACRDAGPRDGGAHRAS